MILDLGLIDYEKAYRIQKEFVLKRRLKEIDDSLIIAEHTPVFTIGRTGSEVNLLIPKDIMKRNGIEVLRVDRGGDITFHGPGQVVLYPIVDLNDMKRDLHWYLRQLEEVVINFLKGYHVSGERVNGRTGVWVLGAKISSMGIGATDWVTYHGLSVNIDVDLKFFAMINPCGMHGIRVTNLRQALNQDVPIPEAKGRLLEHFSAVFFPENIYDRTANTAMA